MTYEEMLQQRLQALLEAIEPGVTSDLLIAECKRIHEECTRIHCGGEAMEVIHFSFINIMPLPTTMAGRSPKDEAPRNTSSRSGLFAQGSSQAPQTGGQGIGTQDRVRMAPCTTPELLQTA